MLPPKQTRSERRQVARHTPTPRRTALHDYSTTGLKAATRQPTGGPRKLLWDLIWWNLFGGRQEARTPDLRVANAALSQLS